MRKLFSKLRLGEFRFGWLEFLFAMYPILAGYQYGALPLGTLVPLIMIAMSLNRGKRCIKRGCDKNIRILLIFVILHQLILGLTLDYTPSYHWNALLSVSINILTVIIVAPKVQYEKLRTALFMVAILSMVGLVYHFMLLLSGTPISPIPIPFLPAPDSDSRLFEELMRPTSFYWEPSSCITFLMVPLFISLYERNYMWASVLMFSIFLSTSTNGIALSSIMIGTFVMTQKVKKRYKVLMVAMMAVMVFLLFNTEIFSAGLDKINNTDLEANARTMNGIILFNAMPASDLILGFSAPNVDDYVASGQINAVFIANEKIFLPTFWSMLSKFGVIGLIIYLSTYFAVIFQNKKLLPYMVVLFVAMFTQGIGIQGTYIFQMLFMLVFVNQVQKLNILK